MLLRALRTPLVASTLGLACSDDGGVAQNTAGTTGGSDSDADSDAEVTISGGGSTSATSSGSTTAATTGATSGMSSETSGGSTSTTGEPGDTGGLAETPPIEDRHGVAYVAHFLSTDLRWYRIDGGSLAAGGSIDMGEYTHDMALDDVGERLYVAHDVAHTVEVYQLDTPTGSGDPVDAPELLATIDFDRAPRFVRVDPYRERIFVVQDPPEIPSATFDMFGFDVSDPSAPAPLEGSPWPVPATASLDLDPIRGVLFVVGTVDDALHGYDVSFGGFEELPGSPVDLLALYPQENMFAFQARSLTADPWTHRLYAGRAQGVLSELIVLDYPEAINGPGQGYGEVASLDEVVVVPDAFDVDTDIADRPDIFLSYEPMPVRGTDTVFLVADAWNGSAATATMIAMQGDPLALGDGCQDHEGFGCFYRPAVGPGYFYTDGAGCLDETHGVVVGTALGAADDDPGFVLAFSYDGALSMAELSDPLAAGILPIDAICH